MSDGQSDVMQSVDDDSDGGYAYTYDSDDNEDDYSEQDEYMQIEEKVSTSVMANYTVLTDSYVCTACRVGVMQVRCRAAVAEDRFLITFCSREDCTPPVTTLSPCLL